MGKYRFRLSDMMPNVWFYKLKDMGKNRNQSTILTNKKNHLSSKPDQPLYLHPRKSYYFSRDLIPTDDGFRNSPTEPKPSSDTHFHEMPRKSSNSKQSAKKRPTKTSTGSSCRTSLEFNSSPPDAEFHEPEFRTDRLLNTESSFDRNAILSADSCRCQTTIPSSNDVSVTVIDVDQKSLPKKFEKVDAFDSLSEIELPPIITKPSKSNDVSAAKTEAKQLTKGKRSSAKTEEMNANGSVFVKEQRTTSPGRKSSVNSPGLKLRINSPKIGSISKRLNGRRSVSSTSSRKSLSDSFAIMKSSYNPQRDFRESMVEMIVENNIRASKDLEDLLACYLSLNSDEYHDVIIKVFKQIWFDLTDIKVK